MAKIDSRINLSQILLALQIHFCWHQAWKTILYHQRTSLKHGLSLSAVCLCSPAFHPKTACYHHQCQCRQKPLSVHHREHHQSHLTGHWQHLCHFPPEMKIRNLALSHLDITRSRFRGGFTLEHVLTLTGIVISLLEYCFCLKRCN